MYRTVRFLARDEIARIISRITPSAHAPKVPNKVPHATVTGPMYGCVPVQEKENSLDELFFRRLSRQING